MGNKKEIDKVLKTNVISMFLM